MWRALTALDRGLAWTRPAWGWLGQLGLLTLGVHLGADQLDDLVADGLVALPIRWPSPELPLDAATWIALAVELAVVAWAALAIGRALRQEAVSSLQEHPLSRRQRWRERWCVGALLAPLVWLPVVGCGAWVVAMAAEDLVAPYLQHGALWVGWAAGGLVLWRLGLTGLMRLLTHLPMPRRRIDGLVWAPLLLPIALLAARGLPVHSLISQLGLGG